MDAVEQYRQRRKNRLHKRMMETEDVAERAELAIILYKTCYLPFRKVKEDGGEGSGNWGHEGRPGKRGGSKEGGGKHNRQVTESGTYTSFSKRKKAASKPHKTDSKELSSLPEGSKIFTTDGAEWKVSNSTILNATTFETFDISDKGISDFASKYADDVKIAIPDSANPNYNVSNVISEKEYNEKCSKAFKAVTGKEYDEVYREKTSEVWQSIDQTAKDALYNYTGYDYDHINHALRNGTVGTTSDDEIDAMTSAIDKSELQTDTILYRGIDKSGMEKLLNMEEGSLSRKTASDVVGKSGTDDGFMSTGSCEGTGKTTKKVQLRILAPAGTKALYAEPFSAYGSGDYKHWDSAARYDGKAKQNTFSDEDETILQRGTSIQVVSGGYNSDTFRFEYNVLVTGQDYEKSTYNEARNEAPNS